MTDMDDEMKECRAITGRVDDSLLDLRKFGFSLITGLLTASAIAGKLATSKNDILSIAALIVMALVVALCGVDIYYQVVLSAAVERALDLEHTSSSSRVTSYVAKYNQKTGASICVYLLYLILLAAATVVGTLGPHAHLSTAAIVWVGTGVAIVMSLYWLYVVLTVRLPCLKQR